LGTLLGGEGAQETASPEVTRAAPMRSTFPGARVLLAEDERVNQMLATQLLKKMGFVVHVVGTGVAAVEAVAAGDVDIVLMDCHMPEMDGFVATSTIRARAGTGWRIPILAMTASSIAEARTECLAAGMDDFITKPIVSPGDLCSVIDRWLAQTRSPGTATAA
jgi:two-component system, sensor histidine kinase and response regulator